MLDIGFSHGDLGSAERISACCALACSLMRAMVAFCESDAILRGGNGQAEIAVVELEDDGAGLDERILGDRQVGDIARNLGARAPTCRRVT